MDLQENNVETLDLRDAVLREQVRLIMKQVPTMQAASLIVALALCYTVRDIVPRANILTWLSLILVIIAARTVLAVLFIRVRESDFNGMRWKNLYLAVTFASGVVWGYSAIIIFPAGETALISLFVVVMASLSAATTVSHAAIRSGPAAWMVPALIPYAVRCIAEWRETERTVGVLIVVYLITLLRYTLNNHALITSSIWLKFENVRLLEEVRQTNEMLRLASMIDGLTGLANRRSFDEFLDKEWRRAVRDKTPISAIMLDIDHFKAYNDNYGHQAGDDCLRKVAEVIRTSLKRPSDFAARYGGEEFVVVLPETDGRGALEVAENLRRGIEAMGVPHAHSSASSFVTVSAGAVSVVPRDGMSSSDLIGRVDKAMYAAKQAGRNRVMTA